MFYFFNSPKQWGRKSRFCWWTHLSTLKEPTILLKETIALFLLLQLWCIFSVPLTNSQTIIWGDRFQLFLFPTFHPLHFFWNAPISQISTTKQLAVSYWRMESRNHSKGELWICSPGPFSGAGPSSWYSHWQEVLESPSFTWSNIRVFLFSESPQKMFINGTRYKSRVSSKVNEHKHIPAKTWIVHVKQ